MTAASDNDKTALVKPGTQPANPQQESPASEDSGRTRRVQTSAEGQHPPVRDASPRLPWPARDEHRSRSQAEGPTRGGIEDLTPQDEATRLLGSPKSTAEVPPAASPNLQLDAGTQAVPQEVDEFEPVTGWVVIVDGPGRGRSLELGLGINAIGRGPGNKICLDFGDTEIHRQKHAFILFDPRSQRFFLQSGEIRNLTYLGDEVVISPVQLRGGERITVGQTVLQFVPLCGPGFDWSSPPQP